MMGAAKKLYVKKDHLVSIEQAKNNTVIHTEGVSVPVRRGEYIATNPYGEQYVVPESYRNKYVEVNQFKDASFYESMAKGYQEMAAINLEEANAGVAADNQAEEITEKFVSGSMNE
ncbi:antitoxin endoai [Bacillus sonorensis]|uniref:antitoxin endoai n=2 Tax=Bacillus sonorensis TaxID=119858 RepID=UPI00228279D8|nr:antitoxin endoai [Bacillus sonorensis]MCY8034150.1 antitoxin endoai [Bacillus sonorensis]